jgi:hypothetical protein
MYWKIAPSNPPFVAGIEEVNINIKYQSPTK